MCVCACAHTHTHRYRTEILIWIHFFVSVQFFIPCKWTISSLNNSFKLMWSLNFWHVIEMEHPTVKKVDCKAIRIDLAYFFFPGQANASCSEWRPSNAQWAQRWQPALWNSEALWEQSDIRKCPWNCLCSAFVLLHIFTLQCCRCYR